MTLPPYGDWAASCWPGETPARTVTSSSRTLDAAAAAAAAAVVAAATGGGGGGAASGGGGGGARARAGAAARAAAAATRRWRRRRRGRGRGRRRRRRRDGGRRWRRGDGRLCAAAAASRCASRGRRPRAGGGRPPLAAAAVASVGVPVGMTGAAATAATGNAAAFAGGDRRPPQLRGRADLLGGCASSSFVRSVASAEWDKFASTSVKHALGGMERRRHRAARALGRRRKRAFRTLLGTCPPTRRRCKVLCFTARLSHVVEYQIRFCDVSDARERRGERRDVQSLPQDAQRLRQPVGVRRLQRGHHRTQLAHL